MAVPLTEPLHPARRIDQLLLPGKEWMTAGTDLHVDRGYSGPRLERIAAGTLYDAALVRGMNVSLHLSPTSRNQTKTPRTAGDGNITAARTWEQLPLSILD